MNKKYVSGSPKFTDKQAEEIGKYLDSLGGRVKPEQLVKLAKSPKNPLHKYFTWDVRKAAEKWLLHEARNLIGCVCVVLDGGEKVRTWHHVFIDGAPEYLETDEVRGSKELIDLVLEEAIKELKFWRSKYGNLKKLFKIAKAIDNFLDRIS